MGEVDAVAVELDHAVFLGQLDVVDNLSPERLEQCHRRSRKRRHSYERLADTRR